MATRNIRQFFGRDVSAATVRRVRTRRSRSPSDARWPTRTARAQAIRGVVRAGSHAANSGHQECLAGQRVGPSLRQRLGAQDNLNALAAHVATDAHLDPESSYKINRTLAIDKIKRQLGRWLLAAQATLSLIHI